MFTVCPKCTLTLAVTAEDLRAGQGYVRCGRCLNVFNALLALSEEAADSDGAASYSQADPASRSQITNALAAAESPPAASPSPTPPSAEDAPAARLATETSSDGAIENESSLADGTGTFETIVLEGDAITQTEEFAPQESVDNEIAALAQRLDAHASHVLADTTTVVNAPATDGAESDLKFDSDAAADRSAVDESGIEVIELSTPAPERPRWMWILGSALLALLVALQAVNHWRDALAQKPSLSVPMTRLYSHLGIALDPHWDLHAYYIHQQGAASDPNDTHLIRVRLSIANRAMRPQPAPLLRLTLMDRYGKAIAGRDLTPAEYWPQGQTVHSFLAHDERIDSEIAVRDPGADSASFDLDVCLATVHGAVRCSGDT